MADLDDPEFLAELVRITADALPPPKVKAKKKAAAPKTKAAGVKKKTAARVKNAADAKRQRGKLKSGRSGRTVEVVNKPLRSPR